jgi:hypothetical protein
MARRHRARIHPAVAIAAILGVVILCVSAEIHARDPLVPLKLAAMALIGLIAGVKVRHVLPVT